MNIFEVVLLQPKCRKVANNVDVIIAHRSCWAGIRCVMSFTCLAKRARKNITDVELLQTQSSITTRQNQEFCLYRGYSRHIDIGWVAGASVQLDLCSTLLKGQGRGLPFFFAAQLYGLVASACGRRGDRSCLKGRSHCWHRTLSLCSSYSL